MGGMAEPGVADGAMSDLPVSGEVSGRPEVTGRGDVVRQGKSLWRHRDFMLLWGGQSVSEIGSAVTQVALPLTAVVLLHASTLQVGLLSAAGTASFLLVALPTGLVVDRVAKRRLIHRIEPRRIGVAPSRQRQASGRMGGWQLCPGGELHHVLGEYVR